MIASLVAVDISDVQPGRGADVRRGLHELAGFVEQHEARPLLYQAFLAPDETTLTVVQVHPDSASMEEHLRLAGPVFAGFQQLVRMRRIDLYGAPSAALVERLQAKARMLGGATVHVHRPFAGFARVPDPR